MTDKDTKSPLASFENHPYVKETFMRFMTMYSLASEDRDEAIARFKQSQGAPPAGVTLLGRWHDIGGTRGFTLAEADDPAAMFKWTLEWSDLLTLETCVVLDDAEFAQALGAGK